MVEKIKITQIDKNKAEQFARDLYKESYFLLDSIEELGRRYVIRNTPNFSSEEVEYIKNRLLFFMRNNILHDYNNYRFYFDIFEDKNGQSISISRNNFYIDEIVEIDYKEKSYSDTYSKFI